MTAAQVCCYSDIFQKVFLRFWSSVLLCMIFREIEKAVYSKKCLENLHVSISFRLSERHNHVASKHYIQQ